MDITPHQFNALLRELKRIREHLDALSNEYKQQSEADRSAQKRDDGQQCKLPIPLEIKLEQDQEGKRETESGKQQTTQDSIKRATLWAVIAAASYAAITLGIVVVSLYQLKEARRATEKAGEQLKAIQQQTEVSERPWISVSIVPKGQLAFGTDSASLSFDVTMKNVGKSVALNVDPIGKLFPANFKEAFTNAEASKWQAENCGQPKPPPIPNPNPHPFVSSLYLFPEEQTSAKGSATGTPTNYEMGTDMSKDEIMKGINPRIPGQVKAYISPVLVGCVEYRFSFQGEVHHTLFNFRLMRLTKERNPDPESVGNFEVGRNVSASEIRLVPSSLGGNTVD